MHRVILVASTVLLVACGNSPSNSASDLEPYLQLDRASAGDETAIASLAANASRGDLEAMVAVFDPPTLRLSGEAEVRTYLSKEVLPFFADFAAVDTYNTLSRAALPDGREGRMHYTYIKTRGGALKPITIAVVGSGPDLRIAYIGVGKCVSDRHPLSVGRCL